MEHLTSVCRIGTVKRTGDEWSSYTKHFDLAKLPEFAAVRVDSQGVCGIYLNGEFIEASAGRFFGRITYVEVTSKLKIGQNELKLVLGSHFFERSAQKTHDRRGAWFSAVAAELEMTANGKRTTLVTDADWLCEANGAQLAPECFSKVTKAEYDRFWRAAALWREPREIKAPAAVLNTVGQGYADYIARPFPAYAMPQKEIAAGVFDFGKLYVGYLELECEAADEGDVTFLFDYSENPADFDEDSKFAGVVRRLSLKKQLQKGKNKIFLLRRRAFRYLKVVPSNKSLQYTVRLRLSMMPYTQLGWFHCSDPTFNKMWEVGKYTLHVNKHREYESCPRHEMKYFSGDGIIDALTDHYTFGDASLLDASYGITEIACNSGLCANIYDRNMPLWDYPAWRIITAYNHYRLYNDIDFIKRYWGEFKLNTAWMVERMNDRGLIYQYPVYDGHVYHGDEAVEWTCSSDRLGEKPSLNALFYKTLLCMGELAPLVGEDGGEWLTLAERVKDAINTYLWSEEKGAYLDIYEPDYIPQDGNALVALFGISDPERTRRVNETLCRENWSPWGAALLSKEKTHTRHGAKTISPVSSTYEAEERFLNGAGESAVELMRRVWGTMLQKGAETFWEFAPNDGDTRWDIPSHAWSSGCTYLLSAYVLGVRPAAPGYEKILFAPCGGFDSIAGVVPTPKGLVAVRCETIDGIKHFTLTSPKGIEIESKLPDNATLKQTYY